ncbi:hypothetical protein E2C01_060308 [Portunus trituberculatus]|uniref:Uncharacterized protein n=1 Tax=Portunus trituberculatus TaxID=210409 RepID=A0A5B7H4W0_PORTR|nr:hypothetical protein [Portunus trituberculatus]
MRTTSEHQALFNCPIFPVASMSLINFSSSSLFAGMTRCTDGNLLMAQVGRQVHRDIILLSSAMASIDICCQGCEFDYWEIIALAFPVEDSELNDNRKEDDPQPGPSSFR